MNFLTDELPVSVLVGNKVYPVNSDFRLFVRFETDVTACSKDNMNTVITRYLDEFYCGNIPADVNGAVNKLLWFYKCGKTNGEGNTEPQAKSRRCYDFMQDAQYIYSAFMAQYKIDIHIEQIHWWTFKALFTSLSDCMIVQIMQYRATDISKIKSPAEKDRIRRLQEAFRLRDDKLKKYASAQEHDDALKAKIKARYEQAKQQLADKQK